MLDQNLTEMLLDRSMDASPTVRRSTFTFLTTTQRPSDSQRLCALLRQGLADTDAGVRQECEHTLRSWAGKSGEGMSPILSWINALLVGPTKQAEFVAETILQRLLHGQDVRSVAEHSVQTLLHGEKPMERIQIILARLAISLDPDMWNLSGVLRGSHLLRRTLEVLDSGDIFMLRQLLIVLLQTGVYDEAASKTLLQIATATLLRCPLDETRVIQSCGASFDRGHMQQAGLDPFRLAALLARQSLKLSTLHSMSFRKPKFDKARVESAFSDSMRTVLCVLAAKAEAACLSEPGRQSESFSELARYVAAHKAYALDLECSIRKLDMQCQKLTQARDFVAAYALREDVEQLRQQQDEAQANAERAFAALGHNLSRILHVAEAVLSYTEAELKDDFPLCLVMDDILRPALLLIDSIPLGMAGICWPALRARAIRCIALHATLSAETAEMHQGFFHSVLERYIPEVLCVQNDLDGAEVAEDVVLTSLSFLVDSVLLYEPSCEAEADMQGNLTQDSLIKC